MFRYNALVPFSKGQEVQEEGRRLSDLWTWRKVTSPTEVCYPWFQASAAMLIRSMLVWGITQRRMEITDVSGQRIGPIFNCQMASRPLKMGPIRCPEMLVRDHHPTLYNTPEERKSHQFRGGSVKSRTLPISKLFEWRDTVQCIVRVRTGGDFIRCWVTFWVWRRIIPTVATATYIEH
jgi:hypothetical protein